MNSMTSAMPIMPARTALTMASSPSVAEMARVSVSCMSRGSAPLIISIDRLVASSKLSCSVIALPRVIWPWPPLMRWDTWGAEITTPSSTMLMGRPTSRPVALAKATAASSESLKLTT